MFCMCIHVLSLHISGHRNNAQSTFQTGMTGRLICEATHPRTRNAAGLGKHSIQCLYITHWCRDKTKII